MDYLIFAAHPDDAELSMGGTIAKLSSGGNTVGIIDVTAGEMGSRGTKETRAMESEKASSVLGISFRDNLGFPDGKLKPDDELISKLVEVIRTHKPSVIFAPYKNDRHPDHIALSAAVKSAMFFSGAHKFVSDKDGRILEPYRPNRLFYYMQTYEFMPSFIVDITGFFEKKMESVYAYSTQFHNPDSGEPETFISQPRFVKFIEARARYFGFKIGRDFGEAFFSEEAIEIDLSLFTK